jgi:secreted PhoX family phosphatase
VKKPPPSTAASPLDADGPERPAARPRPGEDALLAGGVATRGTVNNCASGYTPWGTYLTCEENWAGTSAVPPATTPAQRQGSHRVPARRPDQGASGNNRWTSVVPADPASTEFSRWDASRSGASADGSDDFRNVANTFGWAVEIDPFDPLSRRKRTPRPLRAKALAEPAGGRQAARLLHGR